MRPWKLVSQAMYHVEANLLLNVRKWFVLVSNQVRATVISMFPEPFKCCMWCPGFHEKECRSFQSQIGTCTTMQFRESVWYVLAMNSINWDYSHVVMTTFVSIFMLLFRWKFKKVTYENVIMLHMIRQGIFMACFPVHENIMKKIAMPNHVKCHTDDAIKPIFSWHVFCNWKRTGMESVEPRNKVM